MPPKPMIAGRPTAPKARTTSRPAWVSMRRHGAPSALGATLGALLLLAAPVAAQAPEPLADLPSFVRRTMSDWGVPGVAIGIVRGDSVLFEAGFGVREVGRPEPVDTRTVFGNGSTTKAFTAALIGTLVDEGRLGWDDRVIDRIPDFRLADPYATRETTVRDLLAHRTGVAARTYQLLEYWDAPADRAELVRRLRFEPMAAGLRARHIYHNITFTAAGIVAEAVTGETWEDLLERRLLAPLGMKSSSPRLDRVLAGANRASPHGWRDGQVVPVPWLDLGNIGPAGSLSSNVEDMLRWLRMLLGEGALDGRRVLSAASVREMLAPAIPIPATSLAEGTFSAYGLAWQLGLAYGRKVAMHTGSAQGFRALMAIVPEERLALIVFCNRHVSQYPVVLLRTVLDRLLGDGRAPDRSAELSSQLAEQAERRRAAETGLEAARHRDTRPSLPLEAYTGTYLIDLLAPTRITIEDGRLVWQVSPGFVGELRHWHHDVFRVARWRAPLWDESAGLDPFVSFRIDPRGRLSMEVDGVGTLVRRDP
ncbi:MAG: serine hydrolase [Gemmatimonadales bacterium]